MAKFTFKRDARETGLAGIAQQRGTDIKWKRKRCGRIWPPSHRSTENEWKITFSVTKIPTEDSPAPFTWVSVKQRFANEDAARAWVTEKTDWIHKNLNLHFFED